jgi:putative phosphoribosyl transferase
MRFLAHSRILTQAVGRKTLISQAHRWLSSCTQGAEYPGGRIMIQLPFADREEAGQTLADHLAFHMLAVDATVVALPRGGVPVGFAIAKQLRLPLDVLTVRKLGVPWQRELAMGAITHGVRILDEHMVGELGIYSQEIDRIAEQEEAEIGRREALYRRGRGPLELARRCVILVDDGLATGSTMSAAARCVARLNPARVIIAVPVGSREACVRLLREADDVVCLATPEPFVAVGRWYRNFRQTSDAEVENLLAQNNHDLQALNHAAWRHPPTFAAILQSEKAGTGSEIPGS